MTNRRRLKVAILVTDGFEQDELLRVGVLVVSNRINNHKMLRRTFEGLLVSTFCASTIGQAMEFLTSHPQAVVVCERSRWIVSRTLASVMIKRRLNRFIVALSTGEWNECLEVLKLGAAEVFRRLLQPPDSNLALFRAMREVRPSLGMST